MPEITPPTTANPFRPGTQNELNAHLASTLGADVEQAMERVQWRADLDPNDVPPQADPAAGASTEPGSPGGAQADPAPVTKEEPKASDPAPPSAESPEWEALRGEDGLIAGKWKTPEEARKGIHSLIQLTKSALSERDQLRAKQMQPSAPSTPAAEPAGTVSRAAPPEVSAKRDEVLTALKDRYGFEPEDLNALVNLVTDEAASKANSSLKAEQQQAEADARSWQEVDQYMATAYPEYASHVDAISLYLQKDNEVAAEVNALVESGNKKGAMRLAWLSFRDAMKLESAPTPPAEDPKAKEERELLAREQVTKEERERARIDAGLVSSQMGGVHTPAAEGPSEEEVAQATRLFKAGIKEPYLRLKFGSQLSGPLFE